MTRSSSVGAGHRRSTTALRLLFPTLWAAGIVIPLGYMLLGSFRTRAEYVVDPRGWPITFRIENYASAWTDLDLGQAFLNNLIITAVTVVAVIMLGSLAAYGIARWRGRFGRIGYAFFALGLIIPFQLGLPTLYKLWAQAGLVDTLLGVILIHVATSLPLAVFLYAGFLLVVPLELEEAARVDGARNLRIYWSVVFPLLTPVHATVTILTCIGVWNDLLISLFFLQSTDRMTPSRSMLSLMSQYSNDVPVIYASAVLVVAPVLILFFVLQRYFIAGITSGALKG